MKKTKITEVYGLDSQDFFAQFKLLGEQLKKLSDKLSQTPEKRLLNRKQAAEILQVSLPTLHKYVKLGLVPAQRMGNGVRFYESDVYAALTSKSSNNLKQ